MRKDVTVRALAFITAGHQMHHRIHSGRALLSSYSARLNHRSHLRPNAGMIDVEALIRQIVPGMISLHRVGDRLGDWPHRGTGGIEGAVGARRPKSFLGFNQKEEQYRRERDDERGANHRRGSRLDGMRKGIGQDVEAPAKKCNNDEPSKAAKVRTSPARNCQ